MPAARLSKPFSPFGCSEGIFATPDLQFVSTGDLCSELHYPIMRSRCGRQGLLT